MKITSVTVATLALFHSLLLAPAAAIGERDSTLAPTEETEALEAPDPFYNPEEDIIDMYDDSEDYEQDGDETEGGGGRGLRGGRQLGYRPPPHCQTTFNDPYYWGTRLDYCHTWGQNCGKPAADNYCRRQGHVEAVSWKQQTGLSKTFTIGDQKTCDTADGHTCSGFDWIKCKERQCRFSHPTYLGRALDWCKYFGRECGSGAAFEFCRNYDYTRPLYYTKQNYNPGNVNAYTINIGDRGKCYPRNNNCDTFNYIECIA